MTVARSRSHARCGKSPWRRLGVCFFRRPRARVEPGDAAGVPKVRDHLSNFPDLIDARLITLSDGIGVALRKHRIGREFQLKVRLDFQPEFLAALYGPSQIRVWNSLHLRADRNERALRYCSDAIFAKPVVHGHHGQVIQLRGRNNEAIARIVVQ